MKISRYELPANIEKPCRLALIADLHDRDGEPVLTALERDKPDAVLIAGDLTNNNSAAVKARYKAFLSRSAAIAPSFYSLGNHEFNFDDNDIASVKESGAVLLLDEYVHFGELCIGGLRSRTKYRRFPEGRSSIAPHCDWLADFEAQPGFKILLSHHPEYYEPYLKDRNIDLILSGHAHGGQMRLFCHGLFAPGQGVLPKYTHGLHDGRFIISAGLCNSVSWVPRFGNPKELVYIELKNTADR